MTPLYIGTFVMLCLTVLVIIQLAAMSKFRADAMKRDTYYNQRIDGLEAIIRTEFKSILESLKKL